VWIGKIFDLRWLALAGAVLIFSPAANAGYGDGVAAFHNVSLEAGVRYWRKAAWQDDDFLSELRLGDIYANATDTRYYDPVEAYVWYYLASHSSIQRPRDDGNARHFLHEARERARDKQAILLANLDTEERADARNRIVYVLSCQGADGFIKLGRISFGGGEIRRDYRDGPGGPDDRYGDDRDEEIVDLADSVMTPNEAEALTYFHIAESMGDPVARYYLNDLEARLRETGLGQHIVLEQAKKFHYWMPPFEFYPAGDSDSGIPYTDECPMSFARERALALVPTALPQPVIRRALTFLGWGRDGVRGVQRYQLTIGDEASGRLTSPEAVRLVQTAAVRGDAESQNALGVMYAKGIGVMRNFVRAQYWFQKAADQRYGAALYHLGVLYKVGPEGINQNLSRANDCFTASALAGFRPALNQLGELLARAADAPPRPGQH
jgi:uncharacterized protein